MAIAFLLISSETGVESQLLKELREINGVSEVHVVYGVYDLIAKVEADSMDDLKLAITKRIRSLDHVHATLTLLVAD